MTLSPFHFILYRYLLFLLIQRLKAGILAHEFRNNILHGSNNFHLVIGVTYINQLLDTLLHLVIVILTHRGNHNLLMIGGLCKLLHIQEFLVELLAMTKTGKFNLHIRTSGKADHTLGKIHNLHWLTHVEDVDFTAIAHTAGLKNKAASFGNGHEVTDYLRMGHCYRAATLNLVAETGNDRTVGTQHIAETRSDELSDMASSFCNFFARDCT